MQCAHHEEDWLDAARVLVGELEDIQIIARCTARILLNPGIADVKPFSQVGVFFSKACGIRKNCIEGTIAREIWERSERFMCGGFSLSKKRKAKRKNETNKNPSNPESARFEHDELLLEDVRFSRVNYTQIGLIKRKNVIIIYKQII